MGGKFKQLFHWHGISFLPWFFHRVHLEKLWYVCSINRVVLQSGHWIGSYPKDKSIRLRQVLKSRIAEEISTLKEEQIETRRKKKLADNYEQRLRDMDSFLQSQTCQIPEFDNDLVRRLIASIKVVSADKLIIQFQSGIVMEQEIRYE